MGFPLGDYIDRHAGVPHHLAESGMNGSLSLPRPTAREVRTASEAELRRRLAHGLGVGDDRLFLTHGASEANALAIAYLARQGPGPVGACRIAFPEYPPLFDTARWWGYRLVGPGRPAQLALLSRPNNPTGWLAPREDLGARLDGAGALVVDETFREFTREPSVQRWGWPRLWSTGSFTKVYGADVLRVGFLAVPEREAASFARFHGLVTDRVPLHSVATALTILEERERLLAIVRRLVDRHRALWHRATPGDRGGGGSTVFDTSIGPDGRAFGRRCLRAGVLVCPGSFFGEPAGVRVCLTRRSFPSDLAAYLAVRARAVSTAPRPVRAARSSVPRARVPTGRTAAERP